VAVNPVGLLVVLTGLGVTGVLVALSGWLEPAPSLRRVLDHLQRASSPPAADRSRSGQRVVSPVVRVLRSQPRLLPSDTELRLADRSAERHAAWLAGSVLVGLVVPSSAIGLAQAAGLVGLGWFVPVGVALGGAVLGPVLVHAELVERSATVRSDLRYQVSAYLDVVTMLLAGNTGYEGALEQAAHAGDGRLFAELRRRMRESGARGVSLTDALHRAGRELGLDELEQVAATAALSAAEGAPVARTLSAKCATLRTALATEQESEARLRTSRLTAPIVGMALIFMGLVIYPALSFS
jgi:Flp pilus assembly protein TadB